MPKCRKIESICAFIFGLFIRGVFSKNNNVKFYLKINE